MGRFVARSFRRASVWDFSGFKYIFQVFDQFVILKRGKRLQSVLLIRLRDVTAGGRVHQQKEIKGIFQSERSFMKIRNSSGPRTLPCGTPALTTRGEERIPLSATRWL